MPSVSLNLSRKVRSSLFSVNYRSFAREASENAIHPFWGGARFQPGNFAEAAPP
jgi:hypothetical protein